MMQLQAFFIEMCPGPFLSGYIAKVLSKAEIFYATDRNLVYKLIFSVFFTE